MDCDILKIVRGNDFTTRMTIIAVDPAGKVIDDFSLAASTNIVVKYTRADVATPIEEYDINGNDITIQWSDLNLGSYGFEITGEFDGEAWRYAARILFSIVADNASANIPEGYLVDGVFVMNKWLRLLAVGSVHNGYTYTPSVSQAGIISWTNDGGLPNPEPVNIKGPQGQQGQQGPAGQDGADGVGVPEGGTTGQVLKKKSNTDYDTEWADESGGGGSQVQANWTETNTSSPAYIKNKPNLATVATSGSYNDLSNKPTIPAAQIQSDWNQTNTSAKDYIKNKPTIPAAQVQSNWTEADSSKVDYIKNKPSLATVATSGSYNDLSNKPSIPAAQVNSDWNASSGVAQILNKPAIPDVSGKQDKMSIAAGSGTTLSAAINTYYNFASEVGTLAITLPSVTDTTHIQNIVFMLTTGSTPAVTFAASGTGIGVIAQDGFSIEASTTYEINAIFNGTKWVLACMKLNTTDIQPS